MNGRVRRVTVKIVLDLTDDEIEKMVEQLEVWDEGPGAEGWTSIDLDSLQLKFEEAVEKANNIRRIESE